MLALAFVLHLGLGAAMGLSVDEAHYLLYAVHPALSYFDHPPLVGWVQWPLVATDAPIAVLRLVPGLLWLGTVWGVYRLTLRMAAGQPGAQRAAGWAVGVLVLAPVLHVLGIGLLPDTLLMFLTVALMWQTLEVMQTSSQTRLKPWLLLGLGLGLAGLSKYTAVLAAVAVAVCLLRAHGWRILRNPRVWLALVMALALVVPVAWWNAQNQWISFTYQAQHSAGSAWRWREVLRFLLVQLLAYGPLLCWGFLARRQAAREVRGLWAFFAVPFGVLALLSGGGSSLPHWTAPAWVALAPFAGMALARRWDAGRRRLVGLLALGQGLACVALLGLMLTAGQPVVSASAAEVAEQANPFADLYGWEAAGARARTLAEQQHLASVAVQNWTLASRLGWYARPLPVHVLEDRFDQFDLWAGDLPPGGSALLVDWSHMAYALPLAPHGFADCVWLDTQEVRRWGVPIASFRFYACHGWSGKPQPRLKLPPSSPTVEPL